MKNNAFRSVWLLLLVIPLWVMAATPIEQRAANVIQAGGKNVVEKLVDIGKPSSEDAAAVIVVTAKLAPALLQDLINGLADVMEVADLAKAIALAEEAVANDPVLLQLIASASVDVYAPAAGGAGASAEAEADASIRIGEEPLVTDPDASPS